jgi:cell envelope opacity-associated protein A
MMITRRIHIPAALACIPLAACYPVDEHPQRGMRRPAQQPVITQENPAITPAVITPAVTEPVKPTAPAPQPSEPARVVTRPVETKAPQETPNPEYITASKAPGRAGYVLSPYTKKLMFVQGIPSGTIVPDQTCPPSEKKFFRVP